ncbi:hypothetical protein FGB62_260g01 [Gracilaria domingensis]|nr:hypothetical protein FGB62_260g01 [Gracilaria domingensis]
MDFVSDTNDEDEDVPVYDNPSIPRCEHGPMNSVTVKDKHGVYREGNLVCSAPELHDHDDEEEIVARRTKFRRALAERGSKDDALHDTVYIRSESSRKDMRKDAGSSSDPFEAILAFQREKMSVALVQKPVEIFRGRKTRIAPKKSQRTQT